MVEPAPGPEPSPVAARRRDSRGDEAQRQQRAAGRPWVGYRNTPGRGVGRGAKESDVSPEVDEAASQSGPCAAHGLERPLGGETLADAAEVDGGTGIDAGAPTVVVDEDACAGAPPVDAAGRTHIELVEGPVVARGHKGGEDRRVEPPARVTPSAQRRAERGGKA
jgi:hypothetical protein